MKKKVTALVVAIVFLLTILSGCAEGGSSTPNGPIIDIIGPTDSYPRAVLTANMNCRTSPSTKNNKNIKCQLAQGEFVILKPNMRGDFYDVIYYDNYFCLHKDYLKITEERELPKEYLTFYATLIRDVKLESSDVTCMEIFLPEVESLTIPAGKEVEIRNLDKLFRDGWMRALCKIDGVEYKVNLQLKDLLIHSRPNMDE